MTELQTIFRDSIAGLLRPVIRFAIRRSIKFQEFEQSAKAVFVKIAAEEIAALGEPVTASKLSAVTGLQRREIKRLLEDQPKVVRGMDLITRVIGLWQTSDRFRNKSGLPRSLDFHSREGDFAELVKSVSKDLNPYTVLFELERAGIAENTGDGVRLVKPAFEPKDDTKKALHLLIEDSADLHEAIDQNIFANRAEPNLHIKTEYDNIPPRHLETVRSWFLKHGSIFHEEARRFLALFDRDTNPKLEGREQPGRIRAVIGTFSLTEDFESSESTEAIEREPIKKSPKRAGSNKNNAA